MATFCNPCQKWFIGWQALEQHTKAKHGWECDYSSATFDWEEDCEDHEDTYHGCYCDLCERNFANEHDLRQHDAARHSFKCKYCDQVFKSDQARTQHQNSPAHNINCRNCERVFTNVASRDTHFDTVHACGHCSSIFDLKKDLDKHKATSHQFSCQQCKDVLPSATQLQLHISTFHSYKCQRCTSVFPKEEDLGKHMSDEHVFKCTKCTMTFDMRANFNAHYSANHSFQCQKCHSTFDTLEILNVHVARMHVFDCEKCRLQFDSTALLSQHFASTHVFKCSSCSEEFGTADACAKHTNTQHEIKCPTCKRTFDTPLALLEHAKAHVYRCYECKGGFDSKLELNKHRTSAHAVLAKCEFCPALFKSEEDLAEHAPQHQSTSSEDRQLKYLCPNCAEEYESLVNLTVHIINAHFLRCKKCPDFRFISLQELAEHTASTHPPVEVLSKAVVQYPCSTCSTSYESSVDLANHVLQAHFLRCKQCSGLRFSTLQELSEYTAQMHMPVPISSTGTQTESDNVLNKKLGLEEYHTDTSSDQSFQSAKSSEPLVTQILQHYESKVVQTTEYRCDECETVFEDEEELEVHMEHSPFHGEPGLFCTECFIGPYQNQIELLKHIESKPHKTKWVLSMI